MTRGPPARINGPKTQAPQRGATEAVERVQNERIVRAMNRVQARLCARARPATGFTSAPEPRLVGQFARGRQLLAGNFLFPGELIEARGDTIWAAAERAADPRSAALVQGFHWLDDLAAVGDGRARALAQAWLADWIARFGDGSGPGWTPDLAGQRLIRWITHGLFLLRGQDKAGSAAYFRSAGQQAIFLSRRWKAARPGLPRFAALTGTIYSGLALTGMERQVDPATAALARDCKTQVGRDGGIPSRNPEELTETLTLLTWAETALTDAEREVPDSLRSAIARIAPTLRALRHADGGLARFHGGGRGADGRLDEALAASGSTTQPDPATLHMGYGRLAAGRTTLILDAAAPPGGARAATAHASTLAFELTSGRRPLIVNCGSGSFFGGDWVRAGRATPSHSTLGIDGVSSSRLAATGNGEDRLTDTPRDVRVHFETLPDGTRLAASHDGYRHSHGMIHARTLDMTIDGRGLAGEDLLTVLDAADEAAFDTAMTRETLQGIPFSIRFHLHPEVEAQLDLGGSAVSLTLKSGEIWVFRQTGAQRMHLAPSVYLESGRLKPRATQQVVLVGRAMSYATRIRWSLAKAQDTPLAVRDVALADPAEDDDLTRGTTE